MPACIVSGCGEQAAAQYIIPATHGLMAAFLCRKHWGYTGRGYMATMNLQATYWTREGDGATPTWTPVITWEEWRL